MAFAFAGSFGPLGATLWRGRSAAGGSRSVFSAASVARIFGDHAKPVRVRASDIDVLESPREFYDCLLNGVRGARERVVFSTLYLGTTTEKEFDLIDSLGGAAGRGVRVSLLLDALRARRRQEGSGTIAETLASRLLLQGNGASTERPKISLYHTPTLKGILKSVVRPPFSEILGVCHMKAYVFDDTVVMSGANLNEKYFTSRQDRYIAFRSPELADVVASVVGLVSKHSYRLSPEGDLGGPPSGIDPLTSPGSFARSLCHDLRRALDPSQDPSTAIASVPDDHALVFPMAQLGCIGYRQEERAMAAFLSALGAARPPLSPPPRLMVSSGYLNIARALERGISRSEARVDFLTAAPEASGFYKAAGSAGADLKALIPHVYQNLSHESMRRLGRTRARLHEYKRPGWQFHAKGVWFGLGESLCAEVSKASKGDLGAGGLTMIGSSNYNERSYERDLELSFAVVGTSGGDLGARLEAEARALFKYAREKEEAQKNPKKDRLLVSLASKLCRRWM